MAIGPEPAQDGDTAVLVPERDGFWIVEPTEVRFTDRRSAAVNASPRS
jgi:hypothetical protein